MSITPFHLIFDPEVKELEKALQWDIAGEVTYQQWKRMSWDLNALLCAGTQIWRGIMENERSEFNPEDGRPFDDPKDQKMKGMLREVTEWGCQNRADNAVFNVYFGYLMVVMPYFFGDYDEVQKKGVMMIKRAYAQEPENPLVKVFYFVEIGEEQKAVDACAEIWEMYTPEQWGDSEVQSHFCHILNGD